LLLLLFGAGTAAVEDVAVGTGDVAVGTGDVAAGDTMQHCGKCCFNV